MAPLTRKGGQPGRRVASPWVLGGLSIGELARRAFDRCQQDEILDRAAELSYYFAFALVPTLLFLTTLIGLLPTPDLMPQLVSYAERVLPRDTASLLKRTLGQVVSGASRGLLSIGVLAALLGASSGMLSIMKGLNVAYGIVDGRSWWLKRLIAIALTIGFSLFTVTALLLLVFGERIGEALGEWLGLGPVSTRVWHLMQWPIVACLTLTGLTLVYHLAPAGERARWSWITPGSAVALLSWLSMSLGLRFYVNNFGSYNATYGSIGGIILLMLWLYWSGVTLLVGAEIDSAIERAATERAGEPQREAASAGTLPGDA